jgi:hypothetical protein
MEQTPYIHDFDSFSFFYNVIQSKLGEAQNDLRKLELYKLAPDLITLYALNDISDTHEEQSDFITIVSTQCAVWRKQQLTSTQLTQLNALDKMTLRLEHTVYHILFLAEQLHKKKARTVGQEEEADIHNTQH